MPINNYRHGMNGTRFHNIWVGMKSRCNNPKEINYHNYGGKGIKYCTRWNSFENFYLDMREGYDDNLTLDRINSKKGYYKDNCRWATYTQQNRNAKSNRLYKGKCITQWCEELGINKFLIYNRINKLGWSIEKALYTPIDTKKRNKSIL